MPIINWALRQNISEDTLVQSDWADLYYSPEKLNSLTERISYTLDNFPCDILFVHRDNESSSEDDFVSRRTEVLDAWTGSIKSIKNKMVPVIPIRMTEAWLLINEFAIRKASGNPNGDVEINLPPLNTLEKIPDPKNELRGLISTASELRKRNLRKLNLGQAVHLVSENITDFLPLQSLTAFKKFELDLRSVLSALNLIAEN